MQDRSTRKHTGGRNKSARTKRLALSGGTPALTGISNIRTKTSRVRGGSTKVRLLSVSEVNLFDPKTGTHSKAKLKEVKESDSNKNYVRRNIITKGSVVNTDKGLAIVTNRPGQEGTINCVLQ